MSPAQDQLIETLREECRIKDGIIQDLRNSIAASPNMNTNWPKNDTTRDDRYQVRIVRATPPPEKPGEAPYYTAEGRPLQYHEVVGGSGGCGAPAPVEERKEPCGVCGKMISDWIDVDKRGCICRECEAPVEEKGKTADSSWVNCPICGGTDMHKVRDGEEDDFIISCTNCACRSNGGDMDLERDSLHAEIERLNGENDSLKHKRDEYYMTLRAHALLSAGHHDLFLVNKDLPEQTSEPVHAGNIARCFAVSTPVDYTRPGEPPTIRQWYQVVAALSDRGHIARLCHAAGL